MTTIVYRDGVLAADSCYTEDSESGGSRVFQCQKLHKCQLSGFPPAYVYVGLAGAGGPGLRFLRWVKDGMNRNAPPSFDPGDDFVALVVMDGDAYVFDRYMEPERVVEPYHAIGSGAKCAFVALDMGANAKEAVERAAVRDPYTRGPVQVLKCRD